MKLRNRMQNSFRGHGDAFALVAFHLAVEAAEQLSSTL